MTLETEAARPEEVGRAEDPVTELADAEIADADAPDVRDALAEPEAAPVL